MRKSLSLRKWLETYKQRHFMTKRSDILFMVQRNETLGITGPNGAMRKYVNNLHST